MKLFHAPKGPLWPLHFFFLARGRVGLGRRHPVLGVTERSGKALDWITACAHIAILTHDSDHRPWSLLLALTPALPRRSRRLLRYHLGSLNQEASRVG